MKKAIIALYVIVAVQSVIIVLAFVFMFYAIKSGFEQYTVKLVENLDTRYVLKSNP